MSGLPQNPWVLLLVLSIAMLVLQIAVWQIYRSKQTLQQQEIEQFRQQLHQQQTEHALLEQKLDHTQERLLETQQQYQQAKQHIQNEQLHQRRSELRQQSLETQLQQSEQHNREMRQELDNNRKILRQEFENLANSILKHSRQDFQQQSQQELNSLLKPFREQVNDFRNRVDTIHSEDLQKQSELKTQIEALQQQSLQVSKDANELATALKGQKKMQGNWGELILENVLDRSGLRAGVDFHRELSIQTVQGKRRPDVVVNLPQGKHLVIDSKLSLNAYTRFINSEDEVERQNAMREHLLAIRARIDELSAKDYFALPGLHSPEMVFMFIPVESAFVEAMKYDQQLFQTAIDQKILVATPTTLLTSLNIVSQLWRFENQNRHSAELADKARKVYEKLSSFLQSMDAVGRSLGSAQKTYQKAYSQLYSGKANLIKQAAEFKDLGVAVKSELAAELVDKAQLELETSSENDMNVFQQETGTD